MHWVVLSPSEQWWLDRCAILVRSQHIGQCPTTPCPVKEWIVDIGHDQIFKCVGCCPRLGVVDGCRSHTWYHQTGHDCTRSDECWFVTCRGWQQCHPIRTTIDYIGNRNRRIIVQIRFSHCQRVETTKTRINKKTNDSNSKRERDGMLVETATPRWRWSQENKKVYEALKRHYISTYKEINAQQKTSTIHTIVASKIKQLQGTNLHNTFVYISCPAPFVLEYSHWPGLPVVGIWRLMSEW